MEMNKMVKALKWYNDTDRFENVVIDDTVYERQTTFEDYMNKKFNDKAPCTWSGELWESGEWLFQKIAGEYGDYAAVQMFNHYKPERPFRKFENLFAMESEDDETPRCMNHKCVYNETQGSNSWKHCSWATYITGCIDSECGNLIIAFIIGGWSALEEYEKESDIHPEVFRFLERIWDKDYLGFMELELYGTYKGGLPVNVMMTPFNDDLVEFAKNKSNVIAKAGCWYIRIKDENYIKVDTYKWELDHEGDVVLRINP